MRFSDFHITDITISRDCEFDKFYLLGKTKESKKRCISFIEDAKYLDDMFQYDLSGIVCNVSIANRLQNVFSGGICISEKPKLTFFRMYNSVAEQLDYARTMTEISPNAVINDTAVIAESNVRIDDNVHIGAYTVIHENTHIGADSIVEDGCVIGAPAFYHIYDGAEHIDVKSVGGVYIGRQVHIHSNVVVEKGAIGGDTYIGDGTAIDNCCLIGHNSDIGMNCRIAASSSFAGNVYMGKRTQAGLSVSIAPNVHVGNNVRLSIGAVVTKDIPDNVRYSGNFAIPHEKFVKYIKEIANSEWGGVLNSWRFMHTEKERCA